jgi:pimeloyl-ACP methyl ester carboxylesterase
MVFICQKFDPRPGVTLAYRRQPGRVKTLPGVIFLGGFMSDMQGAKATYLEEQCAARQQNFIRFDYTGHGLSGGNFEDGTIGAWLVDAADILDQLTQGPQVLVGSSMGGWIALLLALKRVERLAGLVCVAPAPDFSEDIYKSFTEEERRHLEATGKIYMPRDDGSPPALFTKKLYLEAKNHLLLHRSFYLPCPVRLIHGKKDMTVPWRKSEEIKARLESPDLKIKWIGDGDHRLSRPEDLRVIGDAVAELSLAHQARLAARG